MWAICRRVCEHLLWCAERSGVLRLIVKSRRKPVVLAYHGVADMTGRVRNADGKHVPVRAFAAQMEHVRRNYSFLSPDVLPAGCGRSGVVVTFDDGYENVVRNAVPLLRKLSVQAVMFLPVSYVRPDARRKLTNECHPLTRDRLLSLAFNHVIHWHDMLELLFECVEGDSVITSRGEFLLAPLCSRRDSFLRMKEILKGNPDIKWQLLKELIQSRQLTPAALRNISAVLHDYHVVSTEQVKEHADAVVFGSHTLSHDVLTRSVEPWREIVESKHVLEKVAGQTVRMFAYPNGGWDVRVRQMVKDAGYVCAMTTSRVSCQNAWSIPRVVITGNDSYLRFAWKLLTA